MDAVARASAGTANPAVTAGPSAAEAMSGATPYRTAGTNDGPVTWSMMRTATNHELARPAPSSFLRRSPVGVIHPASSCRRRGTSSEQQEAHPAAVRHPVPIWKDNAGEEELGRPARRVSVPAKVYREQMIRLAEPGQERDAHVGLVYSTDAVRDEG